METKRPGSIDDQFGASAIPKITTANSSDNFASRNHHDEHILVQFDEGFDNNTLVSPDAARDTRTWGSNAQNTSRTAISKRSSRSQASCVSRQKSRRRELLERQTKLGITLDTSFTRHRGNVPHQVFPEDEVRGSRLSRKQSWFSLGRPSMKYKGLGITKGTPQSDLAHRYNPSVDRDEPKTTDSLPSATKSWQEISPWDRPIPIGISVPTDSISDFSTYQAPRQRSGSEATLVTPSIIITPAAAMQSVWSPDTPHTESDYTPSVYSRSNPYGQSVSSNAPPVPALPVGLSNFASFQSDSKPHAEAADIAGHNRNDTLDSAGTAFEEDDELKQRDRIMSTGTLFEEDVTPLRERTIESSLTVETPMVPTPRRSQGWWNVITTPFVTTPRSAVWPYNGSDGEQTPDIPTVPAPYLNKVTPSSPSTCVWSATKKNQSIHGQTFLVPPAPPAETTTSVVDVHEQSQHIVQNKNTSHIVNQYNVNGAKAFATNTSVAVVTTRPAAPGPDQAVTSPLSTTSATPVVSTAAIGTVLMPRQVEEPSRAININIELQDRRPDINFHLGNASSSSNNQQSRSSSPAPQGHGGHLDGKKPESLPVFAPPPTFTQKGSHFSYDDGSRTSSVASSPDLKRQKKHRKVSDIMSIFSCGKRKRVNEGDEKKKKRRSWCFWCCGSSVVSVLLVIIIPIVVVFTKNGKEETTGTQPGQEVGPQWLNLTNYPAIPTGISTIAQPEAVKEQSGCVAPTTLWSCALPKELHDSVEPNKPDQPNFKIEITFDNSTAASASKTQAAKRATNPVSAGAFIRSQLLKIRTVPSPSPAPPNAQDQRFLGQTTDGNTAPFEGEETPLFITFQDTTKAASRMVKRVAGDDLTNITSVIPPPLVRSDGTAAPANLLPLPSAQPLRLYNRGKDNEHYGFFTYFDRSIFLKSISDANRGGNPADTDGGSNFNAATMRCTFAETRFLVQIWTRSADSKPLLQQAAQKEMWAYKRPGSFPYPVTITLDRHGGNAAKKNLYCYKMETDGRIKNEASKRSFQFEDRAFGGNLVNGTQGRQVVSGPIDGGSGGCSCQWQNWLG